jgi:hypothetical protein
MSVTRPRYKVDANQNAIVDALLAAGCAVQSLAMCGAGVPDLLVAAGGVLHLLEVKQPGETLTPYQRKWAELWPMAVAVVDSPDAALAAVGVSRG